MRINLYGGPGVGKSTLAAEIFTHFKKQNKQIELVQEWAKLFAYAGRRPTIWDQVEGFSRQLRTEEKLLRAGVWVVTDSPLTLQAFYSSAIDSAIGTGLLYASAKFDIEFPAIGLFVDRQVKYDPTGRFESLTAAEEIDEQLRNLGLPKIGPNLNDVLEHIHA